MYTASKKISTYAQLAFLREIWKQNAGKVVFAQGCFDILHIGHIHYLEFAKSQGDILVVGVNGDGAICQRKGSTRPITSEGERVEVIASLGFVDYVAIYAELDAVLLLQSLQPDVFIDDVDHYPSPESRYVQTYGGKTIVMTEHCPTSTTHIIRSIVGSKQDNHECINTVVDKSSNSVQSNLSGGVNA